MQCFNAKYACSSYACSIRVGWGGPFVTENIFTALMQLCITHFFGLAPLGKFQPRVLPVELNGEVNLKRLLLLVQFDHFVKGEACQDVGNQEVGIVLWQPGLMTI